MNANCPGNSPSKRGAVGIFQGNDRQVVLGMTQAEADERKFGPLPAVIEVMTPTASPYEGFW